MKTVVSLSLNPEICASLDRVAESEERSRSQVAERLIRAALASWPETDAGHQVSEGAHA